ncbi:MAG: HAMP domain-containing histidine kinase [Flavobacteriaceae bacterium]|jgi:signal transduction histidine kinase|nr:HAMP domain-containing histidine kinase [Flavobacteriaceae bacterium]
MNLRNRLTTYTTTAFGIVFITAALIIFWAFYNKSERAMYSELKNNSWLTAIYYLEKDELPAAEHSSIATQFKATVLSPNVAVVDSANVIQYGKLVKDTALTPTLLNQIRQEKNKQFSTPEAFYYGIYYPDNQGDFVVVIKTEKTEFLSQIHNLLFILTAVLLGGLLIIYLLSRYISNLAYKPIRHITQQVNKIDYTNLEQGIEVPNTKDELADLIQTYNNLLTRLSHGYMVQKNFINYVSHEFKTPLTAMAGNLEVFAQKDRTPEEYKKVSQQALEGIYKLEDILNNLLLLAGLNQSNYYNDTFRIDEVIWDIYDALQDKIQANNTVINIDIQVSDYALLEYKGNQILFYLALYNLIENAVKYSNGQPINILLQNSDQKLEIIIQDNGKGIAPEDLQHITETFYRGNNVDEVKGSGIGLSLATKILKQHNISYNIYSTLGKGTRIILLFKNI